MRVRSMLFHTHGYSIVAVIWRWFHLDIFHPLQHTEIHHTLAQSPVTGSTLHIQKIVVFHLDRRAHNFTRISLPYKWYALARRARCSYDVIVFQRARAYVHTHMYIRAYVYVRSLVPGAPGTRLVHTLRTSPASLYCEATGCTVHMTICGVALMPSNR